MMNCQMDSGVSPVDQVAPPVSIWHSRKAFTYLMFGLCVLLGSRDTAAIGATTASNQVTRQPCRGAKFPKAPDAAATLQQIETLKHDYSAIKLSPNEEPTQAQIDASWGAESAGMLMWAVQLTSSIPPYDEEISPAPMVNLPNAPNVHKAVLRSNADLGRARDDAELWHWRARTTQGLQSGQIPRTIGNITIDEVISTTAHLAYNAGDIPRPIDNDFPAFGKAFKDLAPDEFQEMMSISMERHKAFNWLCGYSTGNRWDETPTDT